MSNNVSPRTKKLRAEKMSNTLLRLWIIGNSSLKNTLKNIVDDDF